MTIRAFGRLRVGNSTPLISPTAPNALKVGELVASRQGTLYLGIGIGTGTNATGYVTYGGTGATVPTQELGGLIYSDEQAQSGSTYLMLAAPTTLTLQRLITKTGAGTCNVEIRSGSTSYLTALATNSINTRTFPGTVVGRQVQAGQPLEIVVSTATNLTSLIVQVDWTE